ncbi:hypothetical protein BC332_16661 [Capsicum chinense]|nr:hypothetical protein BC332_16661 [Capsicum chinense]
MGDWLGDAYHFERPKLLAQDVLISNKEEASIEDLGKEHSPVMSVQDALDTLIFGLSTPLNTNKFDVLTPNLVMESQWSLPDSQFPPDFPDAQVKELEAAKAHEETNRQSLSKNAPGLGYPLLNFIVAQVLSKNWFYLMTQPKMCWNDEVYVPVNCGKEYHWVLAVIVLKERTIRVYDSLSSKKKNILSEGQQVRSCEFEAASQRACYASLLWHYGVTKEKKGYTSDNDDPSRPKNTFLQSPDESAIVTLE